MKQEFLFAWSGFKEHAWEYDYLKPVSKTGFLWYSEPLHLSHVEAMMTMKIMGLETESEESLAYLKANLDFDKDMAVNHFEITIRMLGGQRHDFESGADWNSHLGIWHPVETDRSGRVLRKAETCYDRAVQPSVQHRISRI